MPLCASVNVCFVATCWERADLLALVSGVWLWVCHFSIGALGQVWYLIVSFLIFAPLISLLFIVIPIVGFCNFSMFFFCTFLYFPSSFAIILMGKRESWLLCLVCLSGVS